VSAITAILVATLLGQDYYSPEEAQALFQQANEAFYKQDYTAARDGYEKLLSRGFGGPDVHYNLGTTHLAHGNLGYAVLAFERARRAGGEGPDLEANLALASAWWPPRAATSWRGCSSGRGSRPSSSCFSSACCARASAPGPRWWASCC
jgi:hypothetical protein